MKTSFRYLITIAVLLASLACSKKTPVGNMGSSFCSDTFGNFELYLEPVNNGSTGTYNLFVTPTSLAREGDIATIALINNSNQYRILSPQVSLTNEDEIPLGTITDAEIDRFEYVGIAPYQPTTPFLQIMSQTRAFCVLPYPGDNLQ